MFAAQIHRGSVVEDNGDAEAAHGAEEAAEMHGILLAVRTGESLF